MYRDETDTGVYVEAVVSSSPPIKIIHLVKEIKVEKA